ncbi:MAG: glycosyltransferase, partial [bacterium]
VWHIDPIASPIPRVEPAKSGNLYIFTHNPDHIPVCHESGYTHYEYLPLCAVTHKFFPQKLDSKSQKRFDCDISFVGSLMIENQHRLLTALFNKIETLQQDGSPAWGIIHKWITHLISNPPAGSKSTQLIDELQHLLKKHQLPEVVKIHESEIYVAAAVEEFLAYLWRKRVVSSLVPLGIHVWGTEEWKADFAQNYRGSANHYLDLPKIYIASKINLDISRINQPNIITMRIFDILACAGFVLADRSESLLELFKEDWDIVCYDTPAEAVDKIKYYLTHESERRTLAQRGYEKVVLSHTFVHRINHILTKTGLKSQSYETVPDKIWEH